MPSIIPKLLLSSQRTDLQIYKNYALIYASLTKADLVGPAEVGNFSLITVTTSREIVIILFLTIQIIYGFVQCLSASIACSTKNSWCLLCIRILFLLCRTV